MRTQIKNKLAEMYSNPAECATIVKLKYAQDLETGFTRKLRNKRFQYYDRKKKLIKEAKVIERINKLRIPPAWTYTWIAPYANYHLQATGLDSIGRKQYIYHPKWNEFRQLLKFYKLIIVGQTLPKIREQIEKNLLRKGNDREKVLSAVIKIIDKTYIRVGNEQYERDNDSYGITTLKNKHVEVKGKSINFNFVGKSSQEQDITLKDEKLAKIVRKLIDLPGEDLFQYEDDDGNLIDVKSTDVNLFLKEISGEHVTAKDFRTWGGTRMCFSELKNYEDMGTKKELKEALSCVITTVSDSLGNTKAVCKSHYIHPKLLETFQDQEFREIVDATEKKIKRRKYKAVDGEEVLLLEFLQQFFDKELSELMEK